MRRIITAAAIAVMALVPSAASRADGITTRSLDGGGNNLLNPTWGQIGHQYLRVTSTNYSDHISTPVGGPSARAVSNRVFNDIGQNVFAETDVSQFGWLWGQFLDHTFGLRDETPGESMPIPYAKPSVDPLERFTNDLPQMDFARTPAAALTGTSAANPRQQINTVSSYIDAFSVYGGSDSRLAWLRDGASLLLPGRMLPRANARGNVAAAPAMDLMGPLAAPGQAAKAVVAGDVRANENIGLTAVHTLFAREHNRIISLLPDTLSAEDKFQIARRVVGAEEQYVTYHEFLPAMGVALSDYTGYKPLVNATLSNEFATVGYRAHSQIHGEMEPQAASNRYTAAQLDTFRHQGIVVEETPGVVKLVIPLDLTFGSPDLLTSVGVGPLLKGLAAERQYKNDEQIDESLRSILFQIPKPGALDPAACGEPVVNPNCFSVVQDLGAIDIQRGRDHGMPYYNALRVAYGLAPKTSFTAITGESTDAFPAGLGPDSPGSLVFTSLKNDDGDEILDTDTAQADAVSSTRASTLAARLKALYVDVSKVDAFVGMVSEPHVANSEFGALQLAIWKKQFTALRDGDRFFYGNDPQLAVIAATYGIDYRRSLADIIRSNTGAQVQDDVFKAPGEGAASLPGLVAAYGFEDAAGGTAVADSSGLGNAGVSRNTTVVSGKFGNALSFNGASSWVTIPDAASLDLTNGMTLEAWVNPTALGTSWRTVVFKQQGAGMSYALYANDGTSTPQGQVAIGGEAVAHGSAPIPLNTWTHLAATYDGANVDLYVNGARVARKPQAGSIETSNGVVRIGGNSVWPEWFKGAIDEVRLYNRALSAGEIAVDVANSVTGVPPAPPLLLGDRTVQPDVNPEPSGTAEAYPTTAAAAGSISNVSVYVDQTSTATSLFAGIYSDNAGHPGQLLSEAALDPLVAGAWNAIALPAVPVAAGTTYWIALLSPDGRLVFRDRCCTVAGSGPTEQSAQTTLSGLPFTWSPGARWDDAPMSAYATG